MGSHQTEKFRPSKGNNYQKEDATWEMEEKPLIASHHMKD
jgi:hypothetical protein